MSYTYDFPQASPCSCIILYTLMPFHKADQDPKTMVSMLITQRDPSVGVGRSLSAGGFDEVKDVIKAAKEDFNKVGQMFDGVAETYREMYEELGEEIKTILPYEDFKARVDYLWDGMVPRSQDGEVHKVVFRAMQVTHDEMNAIMALGETEEQKGKMLVNFLLDDDAEKPVNTQIVEQALTGFKYGHEVEAAKMLFEKLERRAKAHAPSRGLGW